MNEKRRNLDQRGEERDASSSITLYGLLSANQDAIKMAAGLLQNVGGGGP